MLLSSLSLLLVGFTILWAIRILESNSHSSGNPIVFGFRIVGWLFLILGGGVATAVFGGPVLAFVVLGAVGESARRIAMARRRAMLQLAAVAVEHGLPLPEVLQAQACSTPRRFQRRVARLAGLLRAGTPLSQAVRTVRHVFPPQMEAGVLAGEAVGNLSAGMRAVDDWHGEEISRYRLVRPRIGYLALVGMAALSIALFLTFKVMPMLQGIVQQFQIGLPNASRLVIQGSLAIPLAELALCGMVGSLLGIVLIVLWDFGILSARTPGLGWLARPEPEILRIVGLAAEHGASVQSVLAQLAAAHPIVSVRRRLSRAVQAICAGHAWSDALADERLVSTERATLIKIAERAGNLPWACRELAESTLRYQTYRLDVRLQWLTPLGIVAIGLLISAYVISVFVIPVAIVWQSI